MEEKVEENNVEIADEKTIEGKENKVQNTKRDKAGLGLFIAGVVLLALTVILTAIFGNFAVSFLNSSSEDQLALAFALIVYLPYFGFPAMFIGAISCVLFIIAVCLTKKLRVVNIIFMVLAFLLVALNVGLCIAIQG